jgi:hypothetical protein
VARDERRPRGIPGGRVGRDKESGELWRKVGSHCPESGDRREGTWRRYGAVHRPATHARATGVRIARRQLAPLAPRSSRRPFRPEDLAARCTRRWTARPRSSSGGESAGLTGTGPRKGGKSPRATVARARGAAPPDSAETP